MKVWLGNLLPGVAVALAFMGTGQINAFGWRTLALFGSFMLFQTFFVQKYPKSVARRWAIPLKPWQKVEVEGK
jgi:hypothetical protein